jgi:hypothetical protein
MPCLSSSIVISCLASSTTLNYLGAILCRCSNSVLLKLNFLFKILLLFYILISKIIFKNKKYYFNIFINKKHFKKNHYYTFQLSFVSQSNSKINQALNTFIIFLICFLSLG